MPLKEAALRAYEAMRGRTEGSQKLSVGFSEMTFSDGNSRPLSWYAIALADRGKTPVFGCHPPSTKLEIVPERLVRAQGSFSDDANEIHYYGKSSPEFSGLLIKRSDFRKRLKEIASWDVENT